MDIYPHPLAYRVIVQFWFQLVVLVNLVKDLQLGPLSTLRWD